MSPKLSKYLVDQYPNFGLEKLSFDCNDGWFFLLNFLLGDIKKYMDQENAWRETKDLDKPLIEFQVLQVKEKFAGLRFYYYGGDDKIQAKIDFAENLSYYICEETGVFDETVGGTTKGWLKTVSSAQAGQVAWEPRYSQELIDLIRESRNLT